MFKKFALIFLGLLTAVSLSGCATARKEKDLEMQGMRNQISVLEAQVQSRDEEINGLKEELSRLPRAGETAEARVKKPAKKKIIAEAKSRPNAKLIQRALKNAGYDPGNLDGRMGKQTRQAIEAFQKANNLSPSGRADKKTWKLLKEYLYKKVK